MRKINGWMRDLILSNEHLYTDIQMEYLSFSNQL